MKKIDIKKELKAYYSPKNVVEFIEVPEFKYVVVDGNGDPNTSHLFQESIEALYTLSYTIKFFYKKNHEIDYGVMPLEGLWWTEKMEDFSVLDKSNWLWTLMIMQPEFITENDYELCKEIALKKKNLPRINDLKFIKYCEGKSAQIMHMGPFSTEAEDINKIHEAIKNSGHQFEGLVKKHHEIYLNDMRKTAPEKLKTIIRQPYV